MQDILKHHRCQIAVSMHVDRDMPDACGLYAGNGTGITRRYPRPLKRAQDHPNRPGNEGDMVKILF